MTTESHDEDNYEMPSETLKNILQRRDTLRNILKEIGAPHMRVELVNDMPDAYTPLVETALTIETLVNAVLGNYSITGDEKSLILLGFITNQLHSICHLSADFLAYDISEKGETHAGVDALFGLLNDLDMTDQPDANEARPGAGHLRSDVTDIPEAFKNAFKGESNDDNPN